MGISSGVRRRDRRGLAARNAVHGGLLRRGGSDGVHLLFLPEAGVVVSCRTDTHALLAECHDAWRADVPREAVRDGV